MGAIEHLTIAMTAEVAERVRARVVSGDYPDESAVVMKALAALDAQEGIDALSVDGNGHDLEQWLRDTVVPIVEANRRDPSRLRTPEQVLGRLNANRDRLGLQG